MSKYVISITRQFGSLGRPIARQLAELLGIEYYDRDIVDDTARKMKLPVSTVSNEEETGKRGFFRMLFPLGNNTSDIQDEIYAVQKKVIMNLTDKESCIIVGRCSDYILKDYPNHLNIYIYAPYEARLSNCVNELDMTEEEAGKMIREVDKARGLYHLRYAHYLPEDISQKHLMIDSSYLGVEKTAQYLAEMIRLKWQD